MSKEVSGQPEGTTLLECINTGAVPFPECMSYVRWLEWRKETGSRPVKRRDGRSTSTAEEVALWRSVMDFLHDMKEEDEEEEEEEEDDEDESPPPEEPVDDLDGPELIPDAGDGLSEAAALEQAAANAAAAAPSAGATGLAVAGDSALAVVPLSADRRAGLSGPPSTAGSVPATAESLQADLREMFRPDQEPVADYLTRISRIVLVLRVHGVAIASAELDGLATKASLLAEEFGQVGGDWHPTRMVRRLRARFTAAALKEGDEGDNADVQKEIQAIGELIIALGGKQSASADKVWSSPSDVPPRAAGASPPVPPTAFSPPVAGSTAKAASKAPQPVSGAAGLGAPTGLPVAADLGALAKELGPAVPKDADGLGRGDSPLRARLAALEMELEALKRGSDGGASVADGGQAADLTAALKEQTEALKEALSARTGSNSITTVKTDLVWPTLTDDKSDTKDVVLFYEEFEDVCVLANNCRGMSGCEKLLAVRARCKGSRAKAYRAAWKTGEVVDDPEAVYLRIKNKHLMFGESREEREVRIDGEH